MSLLLLLLGCNGSTKAWEAPIEPIVGIANIDDDNQDGTTDWDSDVSESENDFTTFELPQEMKDAVGKTTVSEFVRMTTAFGSTLMAF